MPESLGKILRKHRGAKQLSIEEVSKRTHIPPKIIISIEEDESKEIQSDFYYKSFVRSYAQFLGVTEDDSVKEFLAKRETRDFSNLAVRRQSRPAGSWFIKHKKQIGIVVLAVLGIYILASASGQVKKMAGNFLARHKSKLVAKQEPVEKQEKPPQPKPSKEIAKKEEGVRLEITAIYNSWIRVLSDGDMLFTGTLKKGTADAWEAEKEIKLELGNAGGVTLKVNGKNLGSPGKRGEKASLVITGEGIKR